MNASMHPTHPCILRPIISRIHASYVAIASVGENPRPLPVLSYAKTRQLLCCLRNEHPASPQAASPCLAIPNVRRTTKTTDLAYVPHCVQSVSDAVAIENGTGKNLLDRLCNEDADHAPNLPYPPTNDSTLTLEVFVDNLKLWRFRSRSFARV